MKCSNCGTELGQKNICPICSKEKDTEPPNKAFVMEDIDFDVIEKIDSFLLQEGKEWDNFFDDPFYENSGIEMGYRELHELCKHRFELMNAIRDIMNDAQTLSGKLVIQIMNDIPQAFPEMSDMEARRLAKKLFSGKGKITCNTDSKIYPKYENMGSYLRMQLFKLVDESKHAILEKWLDAGLSVKQAGKTIGVRFVQAKSGFVSNGEIIFGSGAFAEWTLDRHGRQRLSNCQLTRKDKNELEELVKILHK